MSDSGGHDNKGLPDGLYESLRTEELQRRLLGLPENREARFQPVSAEDAPDVLAQHMVKAARKAIAAAPAESRVDMANRFLRSIAEDGNADTILAGPELLDAVFDSSQVRRRNLRRPTTPFRDAALLTASREDPNLAHELRRELESADSVDLICAFIKWRGLRLLESELSALKERGIKIRVITTTYMGATERQAIDELVRRYGAEVRINYETNATRLHAKAWLFRRRSGFDTAYVGSSNLSQPALLDGLEWNVRLSGVGTPRLLQKFEITFDSYWADRRFVPYDPNTDAARLDEALRRVGSLERLRDLGPTGLEVVPYLHQQEMLEDLDAERSRGHHRNLLVAATGTGKTVVAALDYKRLAQGRSEKPTLLFVAHRREILEQSLTTYRRVLNDGNFGELLVAGDVPKEWRHVFASVQSLSDERLHRLGPDAFEIVVVDEFHHAAAPTYRRLLDQLKPRELLGLTATPERGDGVSVADEYFEGRTASEMRLWDALGEDLLVPFHYFGVSDDVDLSRLEWRRGTYDLSQLSAIYTGNDARAAKVISSLRDKVLSTADMRAIGFCVSVQHARYMAQVFNSAGISSLAIDGSTPDDERAESLRKLRDREVNCLFAVDLFNEGLDVPEIDTILLLRPTQSSTVFLQQLGRGLRRAPDKAVLTVLDFIGQQHRQFRFDVKYRALLGGLVRNRLAREIEEEFPTLPSGCQVQLDRVSQDIVLANVRSQLGFTRKALVQDVRSQGTIVLADYLRASGADVRDVYRDTKDSWTGYLRAAQLISSESVFEQVLAARLADLASVAEKRILSKVSRFLHVDDPERAEAYGRLLAGDSPRYEAMDRRTKAFARMLYYTLELQKEPSLTGSDIDTGLDYVRSFPWVASEIAQITAIGADSARRAARSLGMDLAYVPIQSHATYNRQEILAAFGFPGRGIGSHREGVAWCPETGVDAFLVTLDKDERDHSPTTLYKDYAISPDIFHWESQSRTTVGSSDGQRYIGGSSSVVLFTRATAKDDRGMTLQYTCLGKARYVDHSGEKPIAITWKLQRPMPADVFAVANAVAV
ncbi:helicase [Sinomonas cellulolyticus]|nr:MULTISPECIES: DEAD/DEAH box helicase [Sinomonas]GHG57431.1 helicase [Sinomonas sp. KCTC 49339]